MEPTRQNTSFAARAGMWSARHKKTAFFGWLAFVAIPDEPASESVLVQRTKDGSATALKAATKDVRATIQRFDGVRMKQTDTSKDGRSQLIGFDLTGSDEAAQEQRITEIMTATGKTAGRHKQVEVGHFGTASASKALDESFEKDFQKA